MGTAWIGTTRFWALDCSQRDCAAMHKRGSLKEKFTMRVVQPGVFQRYMSLLLSWCLILVCVRDGSAFQIGASQSPPQAAQQSPEQLQQLVAPIALYPDALVAQILAAATYPDQVVDAEKWMQKHKHLEGDKLAKEVNKESW